MNLRARLLASVVALSFLAIIPLQAQCIDPTSTSLSSPTNTSTFDFWDETLLYDEAPPAATLTGNWNFDPNQHLTGATAITDGPGTGVHGFGFSNASMPFAPGEWVSVWVLISACNPPQQLRLGSNGTYLYWGNPNAASLFPDGSNTWWDYVPQPGVWNRLWVPPSMIGFNGTLTNFTFQAYGGQAWFDRFAKTAPWASINSVTTNVPSPVAVNTPVTFTVSAGGVPSVSYQYWLIDSAGAQTLLQDYSPQNTYTWTPVQAGSWTFRVNVRASNSQWPYEDQRDTAVSAQ